MKRLLALLLIIIPFIVSAQDSGRYLINPETGKFDYLSKIHSGSDTVINFGTNNTFSSGDRNGVIGHSNTVSGEGISIGYINSLTHNDNYQFGAFISSDTTQTITFGRGLDAFNPLKNSKYGTIGLGYFSEAPVLYIQSGLESGETWTEDIGGVSIGSSDLDTLTALQITAHESDGSSYLIKGSNSNRVNVFSLDDQGDMTIAGVLTADSIVSQETPTIYSAAADTTGVTPAKIGDIYIDTLNGDTYMSTGSSQGDWVKLNFLLLPFLFRIRRNGFILMLSVMIIPLFGQDNGRPVVNPMTGDIEYSSNYYWMTDTLINFGNGNSFRQGYLSGIIGHNNRVLADQGEFVIGNNNSTGCSEQFIFGEYISCFANNSMTIYGGYISGQRNMNDFPGSIGLGYYSKDPLMYVSHFGGVTIGDPFDLAGPEDQTRLEVFSHKSDGSSYILKAGSELAMSDQGNITLSGTITADVVSCPTTPNVYHSTADTSAFTVPWKVGDFFIDTTEKTIYQSHGTSRGDWVLIGQ